MNILVTGATGFIGKHLVHELNRTHCVHILVRPSSKWTDLGVEHCVEFNGDIEFLAHYLKTEVMRPYIGNVLEGWRALNIGHLIKRGGECCSD